MDELLVRLLPALEERTRHAHSTKVELLQQRVAVCQQLLESRLSDLECLLGEVGKRRTKARIQQEQAYTEAIESARASLASMRATLDAIPPYTPPTLADAKRVLDSLINDYIKESY